MIITRAPARISFAGGGTDLPSYFRTWGGLVVSTTIDRYAYVIANLNGADSAQITSADYRSFYRHRRGEPLVCEGDLKLPRAFLQEFGVDAGLSLFLASEVPPGTGLGSSSTVAVALGKTFASLCGRTLTRSQLADLACRVEIERLGMPIGYQDQYAAAHGGLNVFTFRAGDVRVEPLGLTPDVERALERRTLLFFTGVSRSASSILKGQDSSTRQGDPEVLGSLHRIKGIAFETVRLLRAGDLRSFGELLHDSWQAKKRLSRAMSNTRIDQAYEVARTRGAVGGKITGAGGGGFLMLYCEEDNQDAVSAALQAEGLARMDFHFERGGAVVLMDALPRTHSIARRSLQEQRGIAPTALDVLTSVRGAAYQFAEVGDG